MAADDGERAALKSKPTGPPRLLLGRTRTRSAGEELTETKPTRNGEETSPSASGGGEDKLTCRGRQHPCGNRRRRRWWSRLSSAVCIRRSMESPPEGALQQHQGSREADSRKMRKALRRFFASPDVQSRPDLSTKISPLSFQRRLQRFFLRAGKRRSDPLGNARDTRKKQEEQLSSELTEGHPQVQMFAQQRELHVLREGSEPPEAAEGGDGSGTIQSAQMNQVLVRDVSSEDDEVLFDSELVVDLHDQPPFEEKMFAPPQPPANGPSIRIELCPPDDVPEEEEEEECWDGVSPSENHLLHLLCLDHSERQLVQTARSLVRTAVTAAVDQVTREQQSDVNSAHREPEGCR